MLDKYDRVNNGATNLKSIESAVVFDGENVVLDGEEIAVSRH